ncbi:DNA methyltransferase [Asticcacaulis sp. AND118]|uniref:class I SAM-dependent DNA methyltransferase n=1 Tax=Asticcacaulis sp. AND118 TaxID=2840468 RepID=UPI001CFF64AB|nr:DNA methyltransferase [Asticcacaulis sp. AND118]UDF02769.1 class I SAM-dependent DNA methyltransferase [Asticcacaulis sp. AND118]
MDIEGFLRRWTSGEGGAERANYSMFLSELCDVLEVGRPDPASGGARLGGYQFEAPVRSRESEGVKSTKRIDLYKRGAFILEAKQSQQKARNPDQGVLPFEPGVQGRRSVSKAWDAMMMRARAQAEGYVFRLPPDHAAPLFLITCDVGHSFEIYADFTGTGRNYTQFPDRKGFRIFLEDLRHDDIRARLKAIWEAPQSLDPATERARVTNAIAKRLAEVSKALEKQGHPASAVAPFLMRCVFTMFAEDVGLLPADSFKGLLQRCAADPSIFVPMIEELWAKMDTGGFYSGLGEHLRRFNGGLFKHARAFALGREEIGELIEAAHADWRQVEPAIFGTLLEQALEVKERARLGAHFTPRAYVDRLVNVTVMEPLREEWREKRMAIEDVKAQGDVKAAVALAKAFHHRLCEVKVLDPACGTGNFLYAALELIKRLEAEVLELLLDLGETETMSFETVDPHQFLGIELNPRAAAIAELVVWIGYLQWHYRTHDGHPNDPVLRDFRNIECKDAVLTWEGYPETSAGYANARLPDWPEADFIVGNPPFIGGKDVRERLGGPYVEALWASHKAMNDSADLVMYWWDRAADILTRKKTKLLRFGFVTTNSITQVFQRKTVERWLNAKKALSLIYAIADHPWTKATKDSAAVRIAMTVARAGAHEGVLEAVVAERDLDSDTPHIVYTAERGRINADLTVGVDVALARSLIANEALATRGVALHGRGFLVSHVEAVHLGLGGEKTPCIKPYRNGRDLMGRSRNLYALDMHGLSGEQVRLRHPAIYQHLLMTVKPERDTNNEDYRRLNWWLFGRKNTDLREALDGLPRYISTVETAKHRVFQFLDSSILPDNKLVNIALSDGFGLGVLHSKVHFLWYVANSAKIGMYEGDAVYVKSRCFDPFPFPEADLAQRQVIGDIAEALDAHRKRVLTDHPHLTLTRLYNVLERLKAGVAPDALTPEERRIFDDGLVLILKEYHERLDRAVLAAYGWAEDVRDEEVLARLVALNRERAAEEAAGQVRWLRPDYQIARYARAAGVQSGELELESVSAEILRPDFPKSRDAQPFAVLKAVERAGVLSEDEVVRAFANGPRHRQRILTLLRTLDDYGHLDRLEDGRVLTHRAA